MKPNTRWLVAGAFIAVLSAFWLPGGQEIFNLETLQHHRSELLILTERHYWMMLTVCAVVYVIATALSIPGATVLSLAIGFLFGRWIGTVLIVLSATAGATAVFFLARYLLADWTEKRLREHARAREFVDGFHADAASYLLFLRLVPLFPFWLVNIAPALTPVSTKVYVVTTLIGIIPGSFVFANLGTSLGRLERLDQLLSPETVGALGLLGLLSLLPILFKPSR